MFSLRLPAPLPPRVLTSTICAVLPISPAVQAQDAAPSAKPAPPAATAAAAETGDAAQAWKALASPATRPTPPKAWREKEPTAEEQEAWMKTESERLMKLGEMARDFQTRFPNHERLAAARRKESEAVAGAAQLGHEGAEKRLAEIDVARLQDPSLTAEERFAIRARQVQAVAQAKCSESPDAARKAFGDGARQLLKEFPGNPQPYMMLLQVAADDSSADGRALLDEIVKGDAPAEVKEQAKGILRRAEAVGKPVAIQFTAIDGRAVNVQEMKGKVVLVDFWATWCGPCVAEIPNVKATYEKLHGKGFEIVGISFDQEKEALEKFVKEKAMPWPQFFDGKGWANQFGKEFGINSIPAMWLIDKKGNLRDPNAREDLAEKVEKLLAEG